MGPPGQKGSPGQPGCGPCVPGECTGKGCVAQVGTNTTYITPGQKVSGDGSAALREVY